MVSLSIQLQVGQEIWLKPISLYHLALSSPGDEYMYGLAKETDVSFLSGAELEQVCIGLYQVILKFDKGVSISLECKYQVDERIGNVNDLIQLLGHQILAPINKGGGGIRLQFSNGSVVIIHDSNLDTESYQITTPDTQIIV